MKTKNILCFLLCAIMLLGNPKTAEAQYELTYPPELNNYPLVRVPRKLPIERTGKEKLRVTLMPESSPSKYQICVDIPSSYEPCHYDFNLMRLSGELITRLTTPTREIFEFYVQTDAEYRQRANQGYIFSLPPDPPTITKLANGATAYYIGYYCGARCPHSSLIWEEQGWRFKVTRPFMSMKDLVDYVNKYILSQ